MRRLLTALLPCVLAFSAVAAEPAKPASYFDNTGREDNGSHMAMYDDQQAYFTGLLQWLHKVDDAPAANP